MRIFEVKPASTVRVEHNFDNKISSTSVLVSIYMTIIDDSGETGSAKDLADEVMLKQVEATWDATLKCYFYDLTTSAAWNVGEYIVKWEATIDGTSYVDYDRLYVVLATREDIAEALRRPTSISAGGVTLSFAGKAQALRGVRGVRVGRTTKSRRKIYTPQPDERDYNRW